MPTIDLVPGTYFFHGYLAQAGKLSPSLQHQFQQKETQMPIGHRRDTPQGHRVLVSIRMVFQYFG